MVYLSIKGVKNIMTNYTQLYKEDRDTIEELLKRDITLLILQNK